MADVLFDMGFHRIIVAIVDFIFGLAELILGLRAVLEFLGADRRAPFVFWIYGTSQSLLDPFRGIFPGIIIQGKYAIDFNAIFAIVIYAIISYSVINLIEFLAHQERR